MKHSLSRDVICPFCSMTVRAALLVVVAVIKWMESGKECMCASPSGENLGRSQLATGLTSVWKPVMQKALASYRAYQDAETCLGLGSPASSPASQAQEALAGYRGHQHTQIAPLTFVIFLQLLTGAPILCKAWPSYRGCLVSFCKWMTFLE